MSFHASNHSDEVMSEINMTPLIDVMLVLLVIFIVTLPLVQHVAQVDLPRASSTRTSPSAENIELSVDAQGQYFLSTQAVDLPGLLLHLEAQAHKNPQPQVFIRADARVAYGYVVQAMSSIKRAGIKRVGFVTIEAQTHP